MNPTSIRAVLDWIAQFPSASIVNAVQQARQTLLLIMSQTIRALPQMTPRSLLDRFLRYVNQETILIVTPTGTIKTSVENFTRMTSIGCLQEMRGCDIIPMEATEIEVLEPEQAMTLTTDAPVIVQMAAIETAKDNFLSRPENRMMADVLQIFSLQDKPETRSAIVSAIAAWGVGAYAPTKFTLMVRAILRLIKMIQVPETIPLIVLPFTLKMCYYIIVRREIIGLNWILLGYFRMIALAMLSQKSDLMTLLITVISLMTQKKMTRGGFILRLLIVSIFTHDVL